MRLPGLPLWLAPVVLAGWGVFQLVSEPETPSLDVVHPPSASVAPIARPSAPSAVVPVRGLKPSVPKRILIRQVWIQADIDKIGLNRDGTIETPSYEKARNAAWYKHGPTPGEAGAAVILGHVDSKTERAVFFELRLVKPGAKIEITREDGGKVQFTVESVEQFAKDKFPTQRVYGQTAQPTLRLVTCGGRYDKQRQDYLDNIVVFASLSS